MSGTNGVQPTNMGVVFLGQIKNESKQYGSLSKSVSFIGNTFRNFLGLNKIKDIVSDNSSNNTYYTANMYGENNNISSTENNFILPDINNNSNPIYPHLSEKIQVVKLSTFFDKKNDNNSESKTQLKQSIKYQDNQSTESDVIIREYHKDSRVRKKKENEQSMVNSDKVEDRLSAYRKEFINEKKSENAVDKEYNDIKERYNLKNSDYSLIENKIKDSNVSKEDKIKDIKKYLAAHDNLMKNISFWEKTKNLFGKSEKIKTLQKEQKTHALTIYRETIKTDININVLQDKR
ncbi:hypothetical protein [Proteus penneri]|uniref:hypothetical protein n=1 Tax=Proteus penneri TaxID=102862 RepID=UPI00288A0E4D|nr:hypothetical protein [Proteus penneri]